MRFATSLLAASAVGFAAATEDRLWARQMQDMSAEILAGLQGIVGNITGLNNSLNNIALDGSNSNIGKLLGINSGGQATGKAVVNATTSVNMSSSPLEQSLEIAAAALSLQPYIFPLLDNFVAHGQFFFKSGISTVVLSTLQTQRTQTQQFGDALASKLAQPYQNESVPVNEAILAKFDDTIQFFMSNGTIGGNPTPPPISGLGSTDETQRIIAWINKTRDDSGTLNETISGIPNSGKIPLSSLEALFYQSQNLTADLTNAIGLINQSSAFNISQSNDISVSVLRLQPVVFSLLGQFRQKQQAFADSGQASIVISQLDGQLDLTNQLGYSLAPKLSMPYLTEAPSLQEQFVNAFTVTITQFGGNATATNPTEAAAAAETSTGAASTLIIAPKASTLFTGLFAVVCASGVFGASLIL